MLSLVACYSEDISLEVCMSRADKILESIFDDDFVIKMIPTEMALKFKSKERMPEPGETRFDYQVDRLSKGQKIKPIEINYNYGGISGFSVGDGHHRIAAAKHMGMKLIPAIMKKDTARRLGL